MSEKLSDEHLSQLSHDRDIAVRSMAAELLAIRVRYEKLEAALDEARESHEVVLNSYAAENQQFFDRYEKAEAERDSARALLRQAAGGLPRGPYWQALKARIAKELGPTREDEPRSPA